MIQEKVPIKKKKQERIQRYKLREPARCPICGHLIYITPCRACFQDRPDFKPHDMPYTEYMAKVSGNIEINPDLHGEVLERYKKLRESHLGQ